MSDEKRLIKILTDRYEVATTLGRPVTNTSTTITVYFRLQLIQILDLDEKNQVLTTNCWTLYVSRLICFPLKDVMYYVLL